MGLGYALTEDFPCDDDGRPTNMTLRGLGIIRAKDVPPIDVILVEEPQPRRALRHQGRRRDRPRADRRRGRGRAARPRRRVAHRRCRCARAPVDRRRRVTARPTPGLVCAHHHLYSALARGMPAPPRTPTTFLEILEQVWWRLDAALDLEMIRWSAHARRARGARVRAPPRSSTTTSRPNAIEGSLDVIADACAEVGVRVVVLRTASPIATAPTAPRRAWPRTSGSCAPAGAGWSASTPRFTLPDDTLDAAAGLAADLGVGRAHPRRRGRRSTPTPAQRLADARRRRLAARALRAPRPRRCPGTIAHNPRSNMNNAVGYAPPGPLRRTRSCSAPTASAPTCSRSSASPSPALRDDDVDRVARRRVVVARDRLRSSCPRRRDDRVTWSLRRRWTVAPRVHARRAAARRRGRRRGRARRDGSPTRVDAAEIRAQRRRAGGAACSRAAWRTDLMATPRRALPAGRPPDPRRHGLRAARRGAGLRGGVAGREPARARGDRAAWPRSRAVTERIKVGSGVVNMLDAQPRPASPRRSPRSTTSRPVG